MTESFRISTVIAATPAQIYEAWIDADKHSAMTGSEASVEARPGGRFTAWGPYISGTTLELEPERRIVQSWRTSEFPPDAPDSRLEVMLSPEAGGTRLTLVHSGVPEGQGDAYRRGWEEFYFQPMKRYFARNAETERPPASEPGQTGAEREAWAESHPATNGADRRRPSPVPHPSIVSARPKRAPERDSNGAKKPTKKAAKQPTKPTKKAAKKPARIVANKSAKKPAKTAATKPAKRPAKAAGTKPTKKAAKKSAKKVAPRPAKKKAAKKRRR